jgi:LacI family transcriptional regulator
LLLSDVTNSFWTTLARGVEDEAAEHGFVIFLSNTDEDPLKEERYVEMLLRRRVDGLIIGPTAASAPLLTRLQERNVSFVLVDRAVDGVEADVVRSDSFAGARQLTEHLLATGYRRIAFVGGPLTLMTGRERAAGYQQALRSAGLDAGADLLKIGAYRQEDGLFLTRELLSYGERPDAIITGNNLIALGALRALSGAGLRVPDDIALATFDELPGLDSSPVSLTCAVQPAYELGSLAVELLLKRIFGRGAPDSEAPREIVLPTRLLIGTSCGCSAQAV